MNETLKPTITTIIPTYRRPKQLKEAIRSVLKQTYPHFQVCVYDNASGDDTALVVAKMAKADPRVKYYCHSSNIGAFDNFQYGLEHVETPFFSLLSDDDLVLPEFYETALAGFESHPTAMFSVTDVIHVGIQGCIQRTALETWTPGFYQPPSGLMAILERGHSEWTGILFRKTAIEKVGFLDRETGKFVDQDFTLRMAARCPFVVSKRPGAIYKFTMAQIQSPYYRFDTMWPGVLKMIHNLTEDKGVSMDVRDHAEHVLLGKFNEGLFTLGVAYLSKKYLMDARKAAEVLRDQFGGWLRYLLLIGMINTCQYVPFARLVFDSLISFRRYLRAKRVQRNQGQYQEYQHFISKIEKKEQR